MYFESLSQVKQSKFELEINRFTFIYYLNSNIKILGFRMQVKEIKSLLVVGESAYSCQMPLFIFSGRLS